MSWYLLGKGEDEPLAVYVPGSNWALGWLFLQQGCQPGRCFRDSYLWQQRTSELREASEAWWFLRVGVKGLWSWSGLEWVALPTPQAKSQIRGGPGWLSRKLNYLRNNLEFQKPLRSKGQVQVRRNDVTHTCTCFSVWTTFSSFGGSIE